MMMHSRQMEFDYSNYFPLVEDRFKEADIAVANMEFTLAGEPYTGYPQFSAPDKFATYIAESGVDIFLCANNHILDKGSEGAERTLEIYRQLGKSHGVRFTGAAGTQEERDKTTPLIIEHDGLKVALINFTYGTNLGSTLHWPKVNYMRQTGFLTEALRKAEDMADFTIVLPHWGDEYQLTHSESQETLAKWLIENGADLIIGTHPHVVQDIVRIDGVTVAYSLGNAVSNMSAPNTQLGMMIMVELQREENRQVKVKSFEPIYTWCSRPGGYNRSYMVVPIEDHIDRKHEWIGDWDYDKMVSTYERIKLTNADE